VTGDPEIAEPAHVKRSDQLILGSVFLLASLAIRSWT